MGDKGLFAEDAIGTHPDGASKIKKDWRFWIIFVALMLISFVAALDMTMISTALPSIVADLPVSTIAPNWITSSFLLAMTASQPIFGGLSCSLDRRASMVSALSIFLAGSVVCALSRSLLILVVGRGVQGFGGGGIHSLCEIIMSDLTTLRERGLFFGLIALVFAIAGFIAPILGGAFSQTSWPWIFWINLPIGGVALLLLANFLNIRTPPLKGRDRWQKLDLLGNGILFGSVTSILIAVTEGGIKYRWSDFRVYVPLIAGVLGFLVFLMVEFSNTRLSRKPVFPRALFSNVTSGIAYLQTFLHGVIFYGVIYMVPIYFQAIKDRTPLQSAIWTFPLSAPSAPLAIFSGLTLSVRGKYRGLIYTGWALMCGGIGWLITWKTSTSKLQWTLAQLLAGSGLGMLFPITLPPIQAALPVEHLESATAAYAFVRTFGAVWGITGATTIFSPAAANSLQPLQPSLAPLGLNEFTVLAYVESIRHLPDGLRETVRRIYADAISKSMWLFLPLALVGFFTTIFIKQLELPDQIKSQAILEGKEDSTPALYMGKVDAWGSPV